ncbi:MAG: hypothetical protein J0L77_07260 [Alphaproteobacteria bacterium]|nr:hypothetical protein [Alphaproteobacteria bacterium]
MATALKEQTFLDQDLVTRALSSETEGDGLLNQAPMDRLNLLATLLIQKQERQNVPIRISVSGIPHQALIDFAQALEDLGVSYDLSSDLVTAVKEYWITRGASFSRAVKAKPIWISLDVGKEKPTQTFKNGIADVVALTGASRVGEFATQVVRHLNFGGGGTTSNAGADRVFDAVWGKTSVWLMTEAPSQEDLDGLETLEHALAGIAGLAGGGASAQKIQEIIQDILKQAGPDGLSPAALGLINNMMALKNALMAGTPDIQAITGLAQAITQTLALGAHAQIPPALLSAVTLSLETLGQQPALSGILMTAGLGQYVAQNDNFDIGEHILEVMAQLETLSQDPSASPELKAELIKIRDDLKESLVADPSKPGLALAQALAELTAVAGQTNLPASVFTGLSEILPKLAETQYHTTLVEQVYALRQAEIMTQDLATLTEQVAQGQLNIADLPPDTQALIERLGGIEQIALLIAQDTTREAFVSHLAETVRAMPSGESQTILVELQTAMISSALPQITSGTIDISSLPPHVQTVIERIGGVDSIKDTLVQETGQATLRAQIVGLSTPQPEILSQNFISGISPDAPRTTPIVAALNTVIETSSLARAPITSTESSGISKTVIQPVSDVAQTASALMTKPLTDAITPRSVTGAPSQPADGIKTQVSVTPASEVTKTPVTPSVIAGVMPVTSGHVVPVVAPASSVAPTKMDISVHTPAPSGTPPSPTPPSSGSPPSAPIQPAPTAPPTLKQETGQPKPDPGKAPETCTGKGCALCGDHFRQASGSSIPQPTALQQKALDGQITQSDMKGLDPTVTIREYADHLKSQHEANVILANAGITGQKITPLSQDIIDKIRPHVCGAGCAHDFREAVLPEPKDENFSAKFVPATKSDPNKIIKLKGFEA